jgi:hypothetical protein
VLGLKFQLGEEHRLVLADVHRTKLIRRPVSCLDLVSAHVNQMPPSGSAVLAAAFLDGIFRKYSQLP